uniref:Uncharacterized protein n=1 Tax=Anguilla anguilla TaxID=7936 RepID=A0A0E9V6F6_ANGAN
MSVNDCKVEYVLSLCFSSLNIWTHCRSHLRHWWKLSLMILYFFCI